MGSGQQCHKNAPLLFKFAHFMEKFVLVKSKGEVMSFKVTQSILISLFEV